MVRVAVGLPLPRVGCEKVVVAPAGRPLATLSVTLAIAPDEKLAAFASDRTGWTQVYVVETGRE